MRGREQGMRAGSAVPRKASAFIEHLLCALYIPLQLPLFFSCLRISKSGCRRKGLSHNLKIDVRDRWKGRGPAVNNKNKSRAGSGEAEPSGNVWRAVSAGQGTSHRALEGMVTLKPA